jgi:hypothetical protein
MRVQSQYLSHMQFVNGRYVPEFYSACFLGDPDLGNTLECVAVGVDDADPRSITGSVWEPGNGDSDGDGHTIRRSPAAMLRDRDLCGCQGRSDVRPCVLGHPRLGRRLH